VSKIRYHYRTETHTFIHWDGRIEEWTVLIATHRPPLRIGEESREPWPIWEPE